MGLILASFEKMAGRAGVFCILKFVRFVMISFGDLISNLTISVGGYMYTCVLLCGLLDVGWSHVN